MKKTTKNLNTIKKLEEHVKYLDNFISNWQDEIIHMRHRVESLEKHLNIEYKKEPDDINEYPKHRKIRRPTYIWPP